MSTVHMFLGSFMTFDAIRPLLLQGASSCQSWLMQCLSSSLLLPCPHSYCACLLHNCCVSLPKFLYVFLSVVSSTSACRPPRLLPDPTHLVPAFFIIVVCHYLCSCLSSCQSFPQPVPVALLAPSPSPLILYLPSS